MLGTSTTKSTLIVDLAGTTNTPATFRDVGISFVINVPLGAMGLSLIAPTKAAKDTKGNVSRVRNGAKMQGIHASPISANMVDFHTIWNRSNEMLVSPAMGKHYTVGTINGMGAEHTIAEMIREGYPLPAGICLLNLCQEALLSRQSFFDGFLSHVHILAQ